MIVNLLPCAFHFSIQLMGFWYTWNASIVSGAGIDPSSLVVAEGKVCWDLYIDGLIVSSDGNLLDALGAAIKVYL